MYRLQTTLSKQLPLLLLIPCTSLQAAGFSVTTQSGSGLGNAYAGGAAVSEDASVVWYNPAGMSELDPDKQHLSAGVHLIKPEISFQNEASRINPALTGGNVPAAEAALSGSNGSSDELSAVPNAYWVKSLNDKMYVGLGFNAPFGSTVKYDDDWYGRYNASETELTILNVNPALSYQVNQALSVGGGLNLQYANVVLGSKIDSSAVCSSIVASAANAGSPMTNTLLNACGAAYGGQYSDSSKDSEALIEGDDISYGFNIGALYKPNDRTRFGAHYRSKVDYEVEGTAKYTVDAGVEGIINATNANVLRDSKAYAELSTPETLSLSVAHQLNQRWEILADWTHTRWSRFEELKVTNPDNNDAIISRVDQSWNDSNRYALGVNYQHNPKLKLRAGIAFDETPIPDAQHRNARTPGNDRTWVSVGAQYRLNKKLSVDLGYTHLIMDQAASDFVGEENGYATRGNFDTDTNIVGAQLNWSF